MQFSFSYNKNKTLQGLRYHFFARNEIRIMLVLINVFAIVAAFLFYTKRIRPEPVLLGSFVWIVMMVSIWYVLPMTIYKKSTTFKESFTMFISESEIRLNNDRGHVIWHWKDFSRYFESPHFFHLYFDEKSFFLVPKESIPEDLLSSFREVLKTKLG